MPSPWGMGQGGRIRGMDQGAGLHTRPLIQPPGQGDGFKTYPLAREKDLNHPPAPGSCTPLVPALLVSLILVLLSPGLLVPWDAS